MIVLSVKDTSNQSKSKLIKELFPCDTRSAKQDFTFEYKIRAEWEHVVFEAEKKSD